MAEHSPAELDAVEIHHVLSNERRQMVIDQLRETGETMSARALSEHIAEHETGESPPPRNIRQSAYVSLHQTHLPKLDELGIVEYDESDKTVTLDEAASREVGVYMETVSKYGISWSEYYLGVSVLGLVSGVGGPGLEPAAAASALVGRVGWYAMLAGVVTMLVHRDVRSAVLDLNPTVQGAAEAAGERTGRDLGDDQLFRVVTFVVTSMEEGARTAVPVVVAVAAAGIIPGVISVSGLGPNLTSVLLALSGGSIVVMLLVTAVSSIILGMGMPTTVTYIILISMLATPLVEFGIPLLAAHLFILYFGVIADITPPVAVAAYAASGVAKSDPFETGMKAFSLSLNKAIVPFAFVLAPGIVLLRRKADAADLPIRERYRVIDAADLAELSYSIPEVVVPVVGVFLGVIALGATVIGTLYTRVERGGRAGFALSALLLMAPGLLSTAVFDVLALAGVTVSVDPLLLDLGMRAAGLVLFLALALRNRRRL